MRLLGWIFFGLAIASIYGNRLGDAQFFTLLGCMHQIGASVIREAVGMWLLCENAEYGVRFVGVGG